MVSFEKSDKCHELALDVIRSSPDLEWLETADISIGFLVSDKEKHSRGRDVLGECILVKDLYKAYCPHDFLIVIYSQNIAGLSEDQLRILMHHELLHIGVDEKNGECKYRVVPHDIEDFRMIIDQYGVDWAVI